MGQGLMGGGMRVLGIPGEQRGIRQGSWGCCEVGGRMRGGWDGSIVDPRDAVGWEGGYEGWDGSVGDPRGTEGWDRDPRNAVG